MKQMGLGSTTIQVSGARLQLARLQLARLQLARLEPPSRQCAQQIHAELLRIFDTVPVPAAPFAVSCFGSL
jgi:hypothetical protein